MFANHTNTLTFQRKTIFFKEADETTKGLKVYADEAGGWIRGEVWCEPRIQTKGGKSYFPQRESLDWDLPSL